MKKKTYDKIEKIVKGKEIFARFLTPDVRTNFRNQSTDMKNQLA